MTRSSPDAGNATRIGAVRSPAVRLAAGSPELFQSVGSASQNIASARLCDDLELRAVRCLLVLGQEQHYGRAAARLHMSQPGLSRVIAGLEARVGARLVARSARPVRLTPQGEVLALHGQHLLAQQQAAFEHLAAICLVDKARSAH